VAYVRMGVDGSNVYLIDTDSGVTCWWCCFTPGTEPHSSYFASRDLGEILAHLDAHRSAGHVVPAWVDDDLRAEWASPSD
jgi:hypothetical protein